MRSTSPTVLVGILFAAALTHPVSVSASWPVDGLYINNLAPTSFSPLNYASDNAGGIFMNWNGTVQRISPDGQLLLGVNGISVPLTAAVGCVADGAGGVYLAGTVGNTIKIVRVGPLGDVLWTTNVCQTANAKADLHASSDGAGGALVAWSEARPLPTPQNALSAYCQRIDAGGNVLWTIDGTRVLWASWNPPLSSPTTGLAVNTTGVCASGDGGAFVTTTQFQYYGETDPMYVTFVSSAGDPSTFAGLPSTSNQSLTVIPDGAGGVYALEVPYYPYTGAIRLRRSVPGGGNVWNVILSASGAYSQFHTSLALTPGGVLVAWIDVNQFDVYAQKVSDAGTPLWTPNGVPVCTVAYKQDEAAIVNDFSGGAYVAWSDARYGESDIYLQHLDATGTPTLVGDQGIPITSQLGSDEIRPTLYVDPAGYGILAWNGANGNYAQRISMATVSVAISSFTARSRDGHVVLEAELRSDLHIDGVKIYRATDDNALLLLGTTGAPDAQRFHYEDASVLPGTRYRYQLAVTDGDGEFLSPIVNFTTPALTTELRQNQPNPFNPETAISFTLEKAGRASVQIYAADGARVRTLLDEPRGAGSHRVTWNGRDDNGQPVSSGIYFYRLTADKFSATRKMVLLK